MINRKRYATFYIPELIVDELERLWTEVRAKNGMKMISKSAIVSYALQATLEDMRKRGSKSRFVKDMKSWAEQAAYNERENHVS